MAYQIKPNDTLESIARAYGLSTDQLLDANPQLKSSWIRRGGHDQCPWLRRQRSRELGAARVLSDAEALVCRIPVAPPRARPRSRLPTEALTAPAR